MSLVLKPGVSPEVLRDFGFKPGREFFWKERWCGDGIGYEYQADWYHKFLRIDEETGLPSEDGEISYTDDEFDIPMVQMSFRISDGLNDLYIDCAPSCTYHIGGDDLDVVTDTIYDLIQAGIVERKERYDEE
jgi:hypothetical protein